MPVIDVLALGRDELSRLADDRTVAVLPVGAIEPHGPHLPLSTDCDIARGHLDALGARDVDASILLFPLQQIGASREHDPAAGTLSLDNDILFRTWYEIAARYASWGGRRMIIISSHGGNSALVDQLVLALRANLAMLAVSSAWMRFGQPDGLFSPGEPAFGIHGGDIETSLMLHYAPHKVDLTKAVNFTNSLSCLNPRPRLLSASGKHRFGWVASDLNPQGVVGNASLATAEKGAASAAHALLGFLDLVADVAEFDLNLFDRNARL